MPLSISTVNRRLGAGERLIGADFDFLRGKGAQFRIVVTLRLELRQGQFAIVQYHRSRVMGRKQRFELGLIGVKAAMHVECGLG